MDTFKTAQCNAPQVIIDINNKDYSASADGIEKEENEPIIKMFKIFNYIFTKSSIWVLFSSTHS